MHSLLQRLFRGRNISEAGIFSAFLFLFPGCPAFANDVADLATGKPSLMGPILPDEAYVKVEAKRIADARVVWLNMELLREMGVAIPSEGMTPEFEKQILDEFAYMVPQENEEGFLDQSKTFYADRYGGMGTGVNKGSGRAGSAGEVQIKGIGITPLVGKDTNFDHGHGGASMEESIREAIWGEVNHNSLPHGANRVLAVIDTKTYTRWEDGSSQSRALIVREDPLRSAHYMQNYFDENKHLAKAERMLAQALAQSGYSSESLEKGLAGYARRVGEQYGTAYARGFYHGGTSPSNIELDGSFLDYGTQTNVRDFTPVQIIGHVEEFGKTDQIKEFLLSNFLISLRDNPSLTIPDEEKLSSEFDRSYERAKQKTLLERTGVPPGLTEDLLRHPNGRAFAEVLSDLAYINHHPELHETGVNPEKEVVNSDINYNRFFQYLSRNTNAEPDELSEELRKIFITPRPEDASEAFKGKQILASGLINELKELMPRYSKTLKEIAAKKQITPSALAKFSSLAGALENVHVPELDRAFQMQKNAGLINNYNADSNRSTIWEWIDEAVDRGSDRRLLNAPFEVVLEETTNMVNGLLIRRVYDAQKDAFETVILTPLDQQKRINFFGSRLSQNEWNGSKLRYNETHTDAWNEVSGTQNKTHLEFRIPSSSEFTSDILMALRSQDSTKWWKDGERDLHIRGMEKTSDQCPKQLLQILANP